MSLTAFQHSIKVPRFYKSAARIFLAVKNGGNIKALIKEVDHPNKRGIMALVLKTLQYSAAIDKLFERTEILTKEQNLNPDLASVLVTELLWGKRCIESESKPVQTVLRYQDNFMLLLSADGINIEDHTESVWRPRYIRVNTLKQPVEAVENYFTKRSWKKLATPDDYQTYLEFIKNNLKDDYFIQDFHVKEMFLFPMGTVFATNKLFKNGSFLLQDKSSCLATQVLNPTPGSTVLDMCAAPGMKTSHLAAIMKNQGTIYAVDHDKLRHKTLLETIKRSNLKCVKPIFADVLKFHEKKAQDVDYILLDPSCSGTGMLSRLAYEKPETDEKRLKKLSNLQGKLLRHALTNFPAVKRIVYSTCSIHAQENEAVVKEALSHTNDFRLIDCSKIFKQWLNFGLAEYNCGPKCLRSVPETDCTNGFFVAAFERIFS